MVLDCGIESEVTQAATPLPPAALAQSNSLALLQERRATAISTARLAATTPHPCRSTSIEGTRSAVSIRIRFTCCGLKLEFASSMQAIIEETIGAANEVPSTYL